MHQVITSEIDEAAKIVAAANDDLRTKYRDFATAHNFASPKDPVPSSDYTLSDIHSWVTQLLQIVAGLSIKEDGPFVPVAFLENLREKLKELSAQIILVRGLFTQIESAGGVKAVDTAALIVTAKNDTAIPFVKSIRVLFSRLDAAYVAWYQLRLVLRTPQLREFGKLASLMEDHNATVAELEGVASQRRAAVDELYHATQNSQEKASEGALEISRLLQHAQTERKTIDEHAAEATSKLAEVRTAEERATALSTSVTSYQAKIDNFDSQLETRTKNYEGQVAQLGITQKRVDDSEVEVRRLLGAAENLLKGATNVGLASSFSRLQQKIDAELFGSRWAFYLSIFFLVVLSLPIAFYVFPGLPLLLKELVGVSPELLLPKTLSQQTTPEIIAQIAARALLLVPGIWLVRFTAARHERLFRLREHYAFKYSVASSVEGFKQQAPELKEGIAAAAFYELTFNPATRMDTGSSEARHPNPVMEWMMKKLGGPTGAKKELSDGGTPPM